MHKLLVGGLGVIYYDCTVNSRHKSGADRPIYMRPLCVQLAVSMESVGEQSGCKQKNKVSYHNKGKRHKSSPKKL